MHIWSEQFILDRLAWRPKVPFTLLELRVRLLKEEITLENNDHYWGCFSFVDVPCSESISDLIDSSEEALSATEFNRSQQGLRASLSRFAGVRDNFT